MNGPHLSYQDATKKAIRERRRDQKLRTSRPGSVRALDNIPMLSPLENFDAGSTRSNGRYSYMSSSSTLPIGNGTPTLPSDNSHAAPASHPVLAGSNSPHARDQIETDQMYMQVIPGTSSFLRPISPPSPSESSTLPHNQFRPNPNRAESPLSTAPTRTSARSLSADYGDMTSSPYVRQHENLGPSLTPNEPNTSYTASPRTSRLLSTTSGARDQPSRYQPQYQYPSSRLEDRPLPPSPPTESRYQQPYRRTTTSSSDSRPPRTPYNQDDYVQSEPAVSTPTRARYTPTSVHNPNTNPAPYPEPNKPPTPPIATATTTANTSLQNPHSHPYPHSISDSISDTHSLNRNPSITNSVTNIQRSFPGLRNPVNISFRPSPHDSTISPRPSQSQREPQPYSRPQFRTPPQSRYDSIPTSSSPPSTSQPQSRPPYSSSESTSAAVSRAQTRSRTRAQPQEDPPYMQESGIIHADESQGHDQSRSQSPSSSQWQWQEYRQRRRQEESATITAIPYRPRRPFRHVGNYDGEQY